MAYNPNALTSQSNQAVSAANGSFTFQTMSYADSNGVSWSTGTQGVFASVKTDYQSSNPNYLTSQSNQAVSGANGSFTFQTLTFANSNGVSWSTGTQGIFASVNPGAAQTGISGISGGTTQMTSGTAIFSNSNGVSWGVNGNTITASVQTNYLTSQSNQAVSGANGSFTFQTLTFANSNGVSWSTGTQGIFATVQTNYLTTARASNDAIGLNTALTANGVSVTANSSGLSLNFPAFLTTAMQSQSSSVFAKTGFTSTTTAGTAIVATHDTNGLSMGIPQYLTTSNQSAQPVAVSGSNGSFNFSTLSFGNLNGLSFYTSNGSIVGSYTDAGAGGGISAIVVSAGTTNTSISNISFGNANNVTFGLNGSTVTATVSPASPILSTVIPYFPGSTSSQTQGGFGTSTASAFLYPISLGNAVTFNEVRFLHSMSFVTTSNSSGGQTITSQYGLYSENGDTLSQIASGSFSLAMTGSSVSATINFPTVTGTGGYTYNTTTVTTTAQAQSLFGTIGNRAVGLQFGQNLSLSEGLYWLGLFQRQSTSNTAIGMSTAMVGNVFGPAQSVAPYGSASSALTTNTFYHFNWGVFTSTGSAGHSGTNLPSTMAISGIANTIGVVPLVTFILTGGGA